jgi:Clp amino terminal domain, pathogenicity island component/Sigma-70, region 4
VFERFTDRARRVVVLSQEEARMLSHGYIGTEHLLLGLIHEGEGVAAKALESLDISLEAVLRQVEIIIGPGSRRPVGTHPPDAPLEEGAGALAARGTAAGRRSHRHRAHPARVDPRGRWPRSPDPEEARREHERPPLFEEREKIVLTLIGFEGLTVGETAETLGVSKEKVREIIHAAIERLTKI